MTLTDSTIFMWQLDAVESAKAAWCAAYEVANVHDDRDSRDVARAQKFAQEQMVLYCESACTLAVRVRAAVNMAEGRGPSGKLWPAALTIRTEQKGTPAMSTPAQSHVVTLTVDNAGRLADTQLSDEEALALAQLVKRLTWSDMRGCAVDDAETYTIRDAVGKLQDALARAGYAPR